MEENNPASQKVTNLDYLFELAKGDAAFIKEMIRLFLTENPREIKMLEEGIRLQDFGLINMAAHKLRSTIPFVGIDKVIKADVEEIEKIAVNSSAVQKIEIAPDIAQDIKKIEIVTTDHSVIKKIEKLFPVVKKVCEKAREELKHE